MRRIAECAMGGLLVGLVTPLGPLVGAILGGALGAAVTARRDGMSALGMLGWGAAGFVLAALVQAASSPTARGAAPRVLLAAGLGVLAAVVALAVLVARLVTSPARAQQDAPPAGAQLAGAAYWHVCQLASWAARWGAWAGSWAWLQARAIGAAIGAQARLVFARKPAAELEGETDGQEKQRVWAGRPEAGARPAAGAKP